MFNSSKKKWFYLTTILVISSILGACSSGPAKEKNAESPSTQSQIIIGGNYELTGGNASYGNSAVNAIKLYFEEVNAKGGVLGKNITFVSMDNKSEATEASNVASRLIQQEKVVAILGGAASSSTTGFVKLADDKKTPVISSSAVAAEVTVDPQTGQTREYIFRACFTAPFQGEVMAHFAWNSLKAKKAALLVDNQNPYSKGSAKAFKDLFVKNGGQLVAEEGYITGDKDFRSVLTKIKGTGADVIYVPGYYEEAGFIVKQARELALAQPILGGDGWDSPTLVKIAGEQALNNTFFSTHYSIEESDPKVQSFISAYKAKYNEVPDALAALAYDSAHIITNAIQKANSIDKDKVRDALATTNDLSGVTGTITFDAQHNPMKSAVVIEMKDGKYTFKDKVMPKQ